MEMFSKIGTFLFGQRQKNCVQIPLEVRGKLYVSPMPFGPYDTRNGLLKVYQKFRIEFVVVLVTEDEMKRKGKGDLLEIYRKNSIEPIWLPVADYTSPDLHQLTKVVDLASGYLRAGAHVAVHCNAGVGRTGVITCCIVRDIMRISAQEAIDYVKQYTQMNMTDEQTQLLKRFNTMTEEVEAQTTKAQIK